MRILVVGAGATGGLFGGLLAKAGRDVTFLVRSNRAAQLRAHGLRITGPNGDVTLDPQLVEAGALPDSFDVVLLGVKAYVLESAIENFAPAVGPGTMILPMLNGMRHIDLLVQRFGDEPVLGGVCVVASTLDSDGRIVQLHEMQSLTYGERGGAQTSRIAKLDETLQGAGFGARSSETIVLDMWEKWIFLASLGAGTCLMRGSVGAIVEAGGAATMSALFDECTAIATASGFPPRPEFLESTRERLTAAGSTLTASMYRDLQQGRPVEADQIVGDFIARGRSLGVNAPMLTAASVQLSVYERERSRNNTGASL